jgi:phosphopentomutase
VRRAIVLVVDACGVGALPDAEAYGDAGANTLAHLAQRCGGLRLPAMERLGLGSILALEGVAPSSAPVLHGRLHALGPGKDSTAGHWELMGVVAPAAPPTYPDGFPEEVLAVVRAAAGGREVICNRPYNGVAAIEDFGAEQLRTGALIVYTSQDSVLQLAAHEDVLAAEELYEVCRRVRSQLGPDHPLHAVGRVIARPFTGTPEGGFARTHGRRDFALPPPTPGHLVELQAAEVPVHAVGKAGPLFGGVGVDAEHPGASNREALDVTEQLLGELERGLIFVNLIETDQVYGHRHDAEGFHRAMQEIDSRLEAWLPRLGEGDLLVVTADHGCDVTAPHTDHTREYVPLLARFRGDGGRRHDGPMADVGASACAWLTGREPSAALPGRSFL